VTSDVLSERFDNNSHLKNKSTPPRNKEVTTMRLEATNHVTAT